MDHPLARETRTFAGQWLEQIAFALLLLGESRNGPAELDLFAAKTVEDVALSHGS